MIIDIQDEALQFVRPILQRVAKKYRNLLIHREVMSGKLRELKVLVRWEESGFSFYRLNRDPKGISHFIQLNIAPGESPKSIAFVFAHELSHMLLSGSGDYVSTMVDNTIIPNCLQESMADNLADYVVAHCRFADENLLFWLHREVDGCCSEFAQLLAQGFGTPLEEAKFIDEFSLEPILPEDTESAESERSDDDAFWKAYFEPTDVSCPADLWIHNAFWYYSVLGKFDRITEIFDEYMGEGTFEQICDEMSFYHSTVRNGIAANIVQRRLGNGEQIQDEAELAKQRAFDLIQKFVDIRKKEREQSGGTQGNNRSRGL